MSEPKVIYATDEMHLKSETAYFMMLQEGEEARVYLKSEADAYIRHQKYKRCLAMAQRCMDAQCETEQDAEFLVRWEHRWLTLAEKFKGAK